MPVSRNEIAEFKKSRIDIHLFEPWMNDQIIQIFSNQYDQPFDVIYEVMRNIYEHPFQKEKAIRIVALDGKKVVGFQSYLFWPFFFNGKMLHSYQAVRALVSEDYRGQGIFGRLLDYLEIVRQGKRIDLLTGYPIQVSINSLLRNKWSNILNLKWFVKIISPISVLKNLEVSNITLEKKANQNFPNFYKKGFFQSINMDFLSWQKHYVDKQLYFYFCYNQANKSVEFDLKINFRGRIKELIIGGIKSNSEDPKILIRAFLELTKAVKNQKAFTILSIAVNEKNRDTTILKAIIKSGFKKIRKEIFFCVKDFEVGKAAYQPENWYLYKNCIDTW